MSVVPVEAMSGWESLLATWRELDVPEGYRAEIAEGAIRMTPPPGGRHNIISDSVHWVLRSAAPSGVGVFQTLGVKIDDAEKLCIPDAVAAPRASVRPDGSISPREALIAVEITSPGTANVDRQGKLLAYAAGEVPAYLLIDIVRSAGSTATLYTDPIDGEYQHVIQVPFGETLRLPKPFDVDLDTAQFGLPDS